MKLWLIVGVDDLEGLTFAYCTTVEKVKKAFNLINENGFNDIEIVESDIDLDCIKFDGQRIKL